MSKEVIRPSQFAHAQPHEVGSLSISDELKNELASLYSGMLKNITPGKLTTGHILAVDNAGVIVDIGFKSEGFITRYEFADHELKKLKTGDDY